MAEEDMNFADFPSCVGVDLARLVFSDRSVVSVDVLVARLPSRAWGRKSKLVDRRSKGRRSVASIRRSVCSGGMQLEIAVSVLVGMRSRSILWDSRSWCPRNAGHIHLRR